MALRLLVIEGNERATREAYRASLGLTASESYGATLQELAPDSVFDIAFPTDAGANLPDAGGLEGYDGVFVTGSALNIYDGGPAIDAQIELARAVYRSGTPFFGSCWGLQVATVAAGGDVVRNPRGREIGFARNLWPTDAGRGHALLRGRAPAWDAPCSHIDHVGALPGEAVVLAANAVSEVQAAEIRWEGGLFWGVQYHPEYSLKEIASLMSRRAAALASEGLFADEADALGYADDLRTLHAAPERRDLAFRLNVGADLLEPALRRVELSNFLEARVRPTRSARGRA